MKFKVVLLLSVLLLIGCSDNSTAPADPAITNPSPSDGLTDLSRGINFDWDSQGIPADATYDFYLGTTNDPPLEYADLSESELMSIWWRCDIAKEFLSDVYEAQVDYHATNNTYTGDGEIASEGESTTFTASLDLDVNVNDVYTYTIVSNSTTFTCTATANIDTDATIDTWTIDESGNLTHTINDVPYEFAGSTTYYWKIVAHYGTDSELESDVWSFTTIENTNDESTLEDVN